MARSTGFGWGRGRRARGRRRTGPRRGRRAQRLDGDGDRGDRHRLERVLAGVGLHGVDLVHDVHALGDLAEDRVRLRELVVVGHDEELAAVGVRPRVRHGQRPALVLQIVVELVGERVARSAEALPGRVPALDDRRVLGHAVERQPVEEALLGQEVPAVDGAGCLVDEQIGLDDPHRRRDRGGVAEVGVDDQVGDALVAAVGLIGGVGDVGAGDLAVVAGHGHRAGRRRGARGGRRRGRGGRRGPAAQEREAEEGDAGHAHHRGHGDGRHALGVLLPSLGGTLLGELGELALPGLLAGGHWGRQVTGRPREPTTGRRTSTVSSEGLQLRKRPGGTVRSAVLLSCRTPDGAPRPCWEPRPREAR